MNPNGIRFYSALIDELIKHGIHPVATLYHWDLPLPLQMENDGWLSHKTANAFVAYANICQTAKPPMLSPMTMHASAFLSNIVQQMR